MLKIPFRIRRLIRARSLVTALVVSLAPVGAQAAITINGPAAANHVATVPLTQLPAGATGSVTLNPDPVTYLAPPAANSTFMNTFAADVAQYPGWTAVTGAALGGTLTINTYKARDYGTNNSVPAKSVPRGGADMNSTYAPLAAETNLAWVQMFTDNTGPNGALVMHIDPFPNDGTDKGPAYYNSGPNETINNLNFVDSPSDPVTTIPFHRVVTFQTYLVGYDATNKKATVDDGYSWGYTVDATPEPASAGIIAIFGATMLLAKRRRAA